MTKRIAVPAEAVRTREAILAEPHILVFRGMVWTVCSNCGGNGTYPSGCIPAGMCRFYCWAVRNNDVPDCLPGAYRSKLGTEWAPTYGKRPHALDKYVKQQQANDRRRYREQVRWELERPEREAREAAARVEADARAAERRTQEAREAAEQEAARVARMAELDKLQHVGAVGDRLDLRVTYESFRRIEGSGDYGWQARTRYLFRFRDQSGNLMVLWTSMPPCNVDLTGQTFHLRGTVKEHSAYNGERQTVIQRVKLEQDAHAAA